MANISIEYMILVPLLILQIFLLPYTAGLIMGKWSTSSQNLALQDASSRIGSSIQQLYFFLNHTTIPSGTVTNRLNIPNFINNYAYSGTGNLTSVVSGTSSGQVLKLTLKFMGNSLSSTSTVNLGQNARWNSSSYFMSNSTTSNIQAYKDSGNVIWLSFGA